MKLDEYIITEKTKRVLKDDAQVLFCEGVSNSGKSLTLGLKFFNDFFTDDSAKVAAVVGTNLTVLELNIVNNDDSFFTMHNAIMDYKKQGELGARIEVADGTKIVFCSFDNKVSYKKILGNTSIKYYYVEEIDQASPEFLRELFLRVTRNNAKLYASCNGNLAVKEVYTEYLDRCIDMTPCDTPLSTKGYMSKYAREKNDKWHYYWFGANDNPKMSHATWTEMLNLYPRGTFGYARYISAEREFTEGLAFAEWLTDNVFVKEYPAFDDVRCVRSGIDVGSYDEETNSQKSTPARTVEIVGAYTKKDELIVLDKWTSRSSDHLQIITEFEINFERLYLKYFGKCKSKDIDYAGGAKALLNTWVKRKKFGDIQIRGCNKTPKLQERVGVFAQLLVNGRLKFYDCPANRELVQYLRLLVLDGDGKIKDENRPENDYYDAMSYLITAEWQTLNKNKKL